uniref:Uncharacterized protein n=1 Tax=Anguilla anguilla TaxID=7936 RepID=A0A0E9XZM8_ANGAN
MQESDSTESLTTLKRLAFECKPQHAPTKPNQISQSAQLTTFHTANWLHISCILCQLCSSL